MAEPAAAAVSQQDDFIIHSRFRTDNKRSKNPLKIPCKVLPGVPVSRPCGIAYSRQEFLRRAVYHRRYNPLPPGPAPELLRRLARHRNAQIFSSTLTRWLEPRLSPANRHCQLGKRCP